MKKRKFDSDVYGNRYSLRPRFPFWMWILTLLLLFLFAWLVSGCTITKVEIPDKGTFSTYRFLDWTRFGNLKVYQGTNMVVEIRDYDADREQALKDLAPIAEAIAEGAAKGMVPGP